MEIPYFIWWFPPGKVQTFWLSFLWFDFLGLLKEGSDSEFIQKEMHHFRLCLYVETKLIFQPKSHTSCQSLLSLL